MGGGLRGTVTAFDEHVGLGTVTADDGADYLFHCVEIADGARRIDVGARVEFDRAAGQLGVWEAVRIRPA